MPPPPERHYWDVAEALAAGDVVPFLGAGANLCGRAPDGPWEPGTGLPTGADLARYLARRRRYEGEDADDLARMAQVWATRMGERSLSDALHAVFDVDVEPTPLHDFLARLPRRLSGRPHSGRAGFAAHQLVVTTNYDDTLERAYEAAEEPFDVVTYVAKGEHRGLFVHVPQGDEPRLIADPNRYVEQLPLGRRTVILKVHGLVARRPPLAPWESFVITEDHYIRYLARGGLARVLPVGILEQLANSHLLFLGYGLRDWNLRVFLHGIWEQRDLSVKSWAIQLAPDELDVEFWQSYDVTIYDQPLDEYVEAVSARLEEQGALGAV